MTQSELAAHPEFVAFCLVWERDERCPLGLIDWLMDRDMELQAERAKWAYMRRVGDHRYRYTEYTGYCRPKKAISGNYYVLTIRGFDSPWACDAPGCLDIAHHTYPAAIAHLLFHLDLDQAAVVAPAPPFALECVA